LLVAPVVNQQLLGCVGFFKGTSADQDRRFSDKELKLLKSMKFPAEFDKKVCKKVVSFLEIV
jgi:serine/arginine repetitive matrix protein 1